MSAELTKFLSWDNLHSFVKGSLPVLLEEAFANRDHVTSTASALVENLNLEFLGSPSVENKEILSARLDLLFLEQGLAHRGIRLSDKAFGVIGDVVTMSDRPPGLTYEDLIFSNPRDAIRVFTSGQLAVEEKLFYEGHMQIEDNFGTMIDILYHLRQQLSDKDNDTPEYPELNEVATLLTENMESMAAFYNIIQPESFAVFSRFHERHPYREGAKGAGGQFSASLPLVDILLMGDQTPVEIRNYWSRTMNYMPKNGAILLQEVITYIDNAGGKGLGELLPNSNQIRRIDSLLRGLRARHYRAVSTHIPEIAINPGITTAGEPTNQFLKTRIKLDHSDR